MACALGVKMCVRSTTLVHKTSLWLPLCIVFAYCALRIARPTLGLDVCCVLRIVRVADPLWVWMCVAYCVLCVARPTLGVDVRCVLRIARCATHFGCGCVLRIAYCALRDRPTLGVDVRCVLRIAPLRIPLWVWLRIAYCVCALCVRG